jgi:alkanesulfonate monooxygenase SsuD/methylene tetrahydromethanopterin reductase-like flavin-dependent oxidoreductase (luciferase family)
MPDYTRRYGLLLPHFGEHASRELLIHAAQQAERYGFDSVWVRDHSVFHPHRMEPQDRTLIETFVALSLVAANTERITLGTASLVPHRHPIHTALMLGSLDFVAGPGRIVAGFGIGTYDHEFVAVGLEGVDRRDLLPEQVEIIRKLWSGQEASHAGRFYSFENVDIHPVPASPDAIPIWYCGNSVASVRRAVEYCDGWMPGRVTLLTYQKRIERLRWLAEQADKPVPTAAAIPITSPARTREEALAKVDWQEMCRSAVKSWVAPPSGAWETPDDLAGALIAGPPDHIVEQTRRFQSIGLNHIVYDFRFRFDEFDDCLGLLGEEVLPELRRGD